MAIETQQSLTIRTPEGVLFNLPLAGPLLRFLAWSVDVLVMALAMTLVVLVSIFLLFLSFDLSAAIVVLLYFLLSVGYAMAFEWFWRGQTPGKRLLRLRVVDAQGLRLRFNQIALRNLMRFVDSLPLLYLVGSLALLLNRKNQRLGDLVANTVVVRQWQPEVPDFGQLAAGKYNSFRAYPHIEARLRQQVSPEEAALLLRALLRRDAFAPEARVALYGELAAHLREHVEFPEAATIGLTDEQYLRNAVESLYRA